ncbi:glycosyltransferase family 2 protein [Pseudokordiimonas caeni]|uniref:glycosyltransferase family 2 protein n=1 Tax=Pseudokordiimonas caeni TaxID=2997908 RepID=UPI00281212AD|nr:glycosyltransferase family 2 protein [Pseudokordiimonas caeni]
MTGAATDRKAAGVRVSIVSPTYNERGNVGELARRLDAVLGPAGWEVIFVDDDSPDGTAALVHEMGRADPRVRCLHRVGRRGLSSAVVEGALAASGDLVVVIDADLQHDETVIPKMLAHFDDPAVDLVVGSRHVEGGGLGEWGAARVGISRFATLLAKFVLKADISDPMSGFFAFRRDLMVEALPNLSSIGFKILLDMITSVNRRLTVREVGYVFRNRIEGESKLDNKVIWDFLMLLADKSVGRYIPVRFLSFSAVGTVGLVVHFAVLTLMFKLMGLPFFWGQTAATFVAMTTNFLMNNELTYSDRKLRGRAMLKGWASFVAACSIGAVANVGVAEVLYAGDAEWALSALAGIIVGTVWNYVATAWFTWGRK